MKKNKLIERQGTCALSESSKIDSAGSFIIDYCQRHQHPVNAILHIFGVPMAFFGFYKLFTGQLGLGSALVTAGYFLQYLGHKAQGNEVGEVTLIKHLYRKITNGGGR